MADNTQKIEGGSRLLNDSSELRNKLISRNLYTPNLEYPNTNNNTANKIVNAVSGLVEIVAPFKSFNLKNSVIGRLADSTPLTEIGTVMLAKQMGYNAKSHLSQQNLPVIKLSNLFDGNKNTSLFTKNVNLKITNKEDKTFADKIGNFFEKINFNNSSSNDNPFNKNSTNADYIKNSGEGQLNFLYSSINRNIYKQDDSTLNEYGIKIKNPIQPRSNLVVYGKKSFFNFSNSYENPYIKFHPTIYSEIPANKAMILSYNTNNEIQEYAPNADYVANNFGRTDINQKYGLNNIDPNEWVDKNQEFNSNIDNQLIWGLNGASAELNENNSRLRGDTNQVDNDYSQKFENGFFGENNGDLNYSKFGIKGGLLEYTKNLINATEGRIGDLTRKAFVDGNNNNAGFNGSGLWKSNNSIYAQKSQIANKTGVRQHTILDQYDRFTKAIRFNGNQVYGGNVNSVIYNTVLPRIHPTLPLNEFGIPNNKNLMFSIENLAVGVISKGDYGIIDDEFGSQIPICEVGPFNGRIMWFPPYNMELTETATAKYESTVMVGRNEPMYNYMNSERSAQLGFTLIMDYPEQLKQYHNTTDNQRDITEFFAFGGDPYVGNPNTSGPTELLINELQKDIEEIEGTKDVEDPNVKIPSAIRVVFPNQIPETFDNLNTVFDRIYTDLHYEIKEGLPSCDGTSWGLNDKFYLPVGLVKDDVGKWKFDKSLLPPNFTQYTLTDSCPLNDMLKDFFSNENNRKFYDIIVHGGATILYTEHIPNDIKEGVIYNKKLGLRRTDSTIHLIKKRLESIFETNFENLGITIGYGGKFKDGSDGSSESSPRFARMANIGEKGAKLERYALIEIVRNEKTPEKTVKKTLTTNELETIEIKRNEIEKLESDLLRKKGLPYDCIFSERNSKDGILHGFQSISGNKYSPVFHSQTPEDFHKRLTFLQQCVRQGAAKRYDSQQNSSLSGKNSVFGRQPICILRIGDFFYTKIIIESVNIDYNEATWDMNPEGMGMQPMIAKVSLQVKIIGGQSLKGPIDALQNAVSFNYYANSTFTDKGMYKLPSTVADNQEAYINGILNEKVSKLNKAYDAKFKK